MQAGASALLAATCRKEQSGRVQPVGERKWRHTGREGDDGEAAAGAEPQKSILGVAVERKAMPKMCFLIQ